MDPIKATLKEAQGLLYRQNAQAALEYVRSSPHVGAPAVIAWMHSLVFNHHASLPASLRAEAFLDPVYCSCDACPAEWLVAPLAQHVSGLPFQQEETGYRCPSCDRVLCGKCGRKRSVLKLCSCGAALERIDRPTCRRRKKSPAVEENVLGQFLRDSLPEPAEERAGAAKDLHLYFGYRGRVPIGVDPSLPLRPTSIAEDHLTWAEELLDAGVYFQAEQQLQLASEPADASARAAWLTARLELVRYANACERSRRQLDHPSESDWRKSPERIDQWLEQAVALSPSFGPAWLTAAEVELNKSSGRKPDRALVCAQNAQRLLGDTPQVLLAVGRAFRATDRPAEAVRVLSRIPSFRLPENATQQLQLARWEARCKAESIDVEAHFELSQWHFLYGSRAQAHAFSSRLVAQAPHRPEGYFGLAHLLFAYHGPELTAEDRYSEAYRLCQEALKCDSRFGFALELLASIFDRVDRRRLDVSFKIEDPLEYYRRALDCEPRCAIAMWRLASQCIDRGELEAALSLLERAVALDIAVSEVYRILAAIYQGKHRFKDWQRALEKADELSPDTVLTGELTERILRLCSYEL